MKLLTEDMKQLTGGQVIVELDPVKAADKIEAVIREKRQELNI